MYCVLFISLTVALSVSIEADPQQGSVYGRSGKGAMVSVTLCELSLLTMPHDESVGRFDS
jgi:hypothetical protein